MPAKRAWRKLVKKQQRQRRRQRQARAREKEEALEEKALKAKPEYEAWLKQQAELEEFQRQASERLRAEEEEAWLRREALAQRQFQIDRAKRQQEEAKLESLRLQQAKELEEELEKQRKRREESKRLAEQAAAEFEAMLQRMQEYMDDSEDRTPPAELRRVVETNPAEKLCEFYTRTNCCRYGNSCTFNHRRPMLAKILLIRHFFTHPLLQVGETHKEYASTDEHLELTEQDLRSDYDEFFRDAIGELEKFGKILNFRAVRNTLPHLRGHVFVEYAKERFALRAFVNLQGRYYASRRLQVEFSNLKGWRGAVCGYSCGYLHLFRNPNNLFNSSLELYDTPKSTRSSSRTPTNRASSWHDNIRESRNWRWSESPELELKQDKSSSKSAKRQQSNERDIKCKSDKSRNRYHSSRDSSRHSSQECDSDSVRDRSRDSSLHHSRDAGQDSGHRSRSRSRNRSTSGREHVSKADHSHSRSPPRRRVK
ncbi:hypothetical protein AWZ03_000263 [Drosophila navojoa]|uniref:C3H1-type domain-containing protein n=1 Tax=Drosophila navojoa TaxID=7232 RepID=A0A484BX92_DRONA|nr:hypothetical protein AWZ03_000263 [Drosophila navojoa]